MCCYRKWLRKCHYESTKRIEKWFSQHTVMAQTRDALLRDIQEMVKYDEKKKASGIFVVPNCYD